MKYTTLYILPITFIMACSSAGQNLANKSNPASIYGIIEVTVIDVEKGMAIPGQTVLIVDERIDQIGKSTDIKLPGQAKIIDGHGLFLMPGLVDAHVHFLDPQVFGRLMIANGVLLVRDTGMSNDFILPLRGELNRGEITGPEMVATGSMLDGDPPLIPSVSIGIHTSDEARAAVRQQVAAGADMIKAYNFLEREVFLAILDEAKKSQIKVVSHLPESIYLEDAAAAGLDSIEHFHGFEKAIAKLLGDPVSLTYAGMGSQAGYLQRLNEVDPQALLAFYQRLQVSGLTVCPTIVTFKKGTEIRAFQSEDFPHREYISQTVLDTWKSQWSQQTTLPDFIWQNWAKIVAGLNKAGVPLMVGTDLIIPGIIPGFAVHEEMTIWQEAGIPPADILRSGTIVPARFMGLEERLGSISPGKDASMVLVRANPLEDIQNAQQIEAVFLRGDYYNREALDHLLEEAKDLASQTSP